MPALDTKTNRANPTDQRVKEELHGMVQTSKALQEYLEQADSALDSKVAAIRWPEDSYVWGSEGGMAIFMQQIAKQADTDRSLVVCGSSNVPVPTSAEQVPSEDRCADVVVLFPDASTLLKVESWKRVDDVWERLFQLTGTRLTDERLLDDVLIFGELKENAKKKTKARDQLYRRFYRATMTHPIRQWIFGFTLCGSELRVYVHTPTGIIHSERIDCTQESGLRLFKRMLLRFLENDLHTLGAIAFAGSFPFPLNMANLPPQADPPVALSSRPPVITLLHRQLVHPAMLGSRPLVYLVELEEPNSELVGGSQASFVGQQPTRLAPHTMRLAFASQGDVRRGQRLEQIVRMTRSSVLQFLPTRKLALLNDNHYWTVPPSIGRGDTSYRFVPRTLKCEVFNGAYRTVLEIESTSAMVEFNIGIIQGVQFLLGQGLLPRNFSNGSMMLGPAGQGILTDLDHMIFLDDTSAASKLRESSGVLAFLPKGGYPDNDGRTAIVPHALWHILESLTNISQYVVCSRPGGAQGPQQMSVDACELWTEWNDEASKAAIESKSAHYDQVHNSLFELMYPPFWVGLPELFVIMSRYCCLRGPPDGNTAAHLRQQDHGMQRRWGIGGDLSLDKILVELKQLKLRL